MADLAHTSAQEHSQALNALAKASHNHQQNTQELATQLKYQGSLNPDVLENGIRESQARIGAEIFQIGARLILIKEQSPHGEFHQRLKQLDIHPRVAQRFMQVSLRFSNATISSHLAQMGKSKVLELLVLEDQELKELTEEGSVRGLKLDDIDRMPVSELRKKLREANNKTVAQQKLIEAKNEKIDALIVNSDSSSQPLVRPDEQLIRLQSQTAVLSQQLSATIMTELRSLFTQIIDHHSLNQGDSSQILRGHLNQISNELADLRDDFHLIDIHDGTPAWQAWQQQQDQNQLDMLHEQPQPEA